MKRILLAVLIASAAHADYVEIGSGGALTTNRPFCGS